MPYGREALSIALRQLSDQYPAQPLIRYRMINYLLTTVSLNGGWVPETFWSFHYWQLAPRWRLLPWLKNPGNSAMSPHTGKGSRHPSLWINCLDDELPFQTTMKVHTQSTHKTLKWWAYGIWTHAHMQKLITTWEHWCSLLFTLLNCIQLHQKSSWKCAFKSRVTNL